ncbi:MAG TPA: dihydrofolate reductase [Chitinophagaceae bacterium]|nr:dihydrofolate reductase [Chitinophagaceae bacterium]
MLVSLVVAASENNAIGKQNKLLWYLPNDLKFLKNLTWGMPVVMGRKTFESVDSKPLKGRVNIIITRQKDFEAPGIVVVNSLKDALFFTAENDYKELMVLGGAQIYEEAMPKADRIYLTRVHAFFEEADAFFPEIEEKKWKLVSNRDFPADEKHQYPYSFEVWERK